MKLQKPTIGCALPMRLFCDLKDARERGTEITDPISLALLGAFGGEDALFGFLSAHAQYIELRAVHGRMKPEEVLFAAERCHTAGLRITVHGSAEAHSCAEAFYAPYLSLFSSGLQERYNITVHALPERGETEALLTDLLETAEREGYPVRLTLENNRRKGERRCGDSLGEVCEIKEKLGCDRLAVCWDMGHYTSDMRKFGCCGEQISAGDVNLPPREQLSAIGHTHIHALVNGTTHFPLHMGELALKEAAAALQSAGYPGIYSLELDFPRFLSVCSAKDALTESFRVLEEALAAAVPALITKEGVLRAVDHMRNRTERMLPLWWERLMREKEQPRDGFGLFGPTSYVLRAGDAKLLIDPCLREEAWTAAIRERVVSDLSSFDAVIYTHDHIDHLDPHFISVAAEAELPWVVPEFFSVSRLEKYGLSRDRLDRIAAGETRTYRGTVLRAFASNHKRETRETGLPELGYRISTPAGKTYLFPCDVRTYDSAFYGDLAGSAPDWMFAHLWLGGGEALTPPWEPLLSGFCRFVGDFAPKKLVIAHLYETGRTADEVWTWRHMGLAADRLLAEVPETEVVFTVPGTWYPME